MSLFKKEKKESKSEYLRRIADEETENLKYVMEKSLELEDHFERLKMLKSDPGILEAVNLARGILNTGYYSPEDEIIFKALLRLAGEPDDAENANAI